jgi:hypothetical protein
VSFMMFVPSKKNRYRLLELITVFLFLIGDLMPLSTLCLAENNNVLGEDNNKTNKIPNGE